MNLQLWSTVSASRQFHRIANVKIRDSALYTIASLRQAGPALGVSSQPPKAGPATSILAECSRGSRWSCFSQAEQRAGLYCIMLAATSISTVTFLRLPNSVEFRKHGLPI